MFLGTMNLAVLELGHWAAAPLSTALLASWGANVIKVEHPVRGDPLRGWMTFSAPGDDDFNCFWELTNHNKKSLGVDLSTDEGKEIMYRLVRTSDAVVTNFRSPVLRSLGMDYDTLSQINSRIVYGQVSAFGEIGPDRDKPGFDETGFWCLSGNLEGMGEPGTPGATLHSLQTMGDANAAMQLVAGIALALLKRELTGHGQKVCVSLLGAGIWAGLYRLQAACASKEHLVGKVSRKDRINALYNTYETKDGRLLMFTMPDADRYWGPFCEALGVPERIAEQFNSLDRRLENPTALVAIIDEVIRTKSLAEWKETLDATPVLVWAPILTPNEVARHEQVLANDYIESFVHPVYGTREIVGCPIQISGSPYTIDRAPEVGEHTEEILLKLGYDWRSIERLNEQHVIVGQSQRGDSRRE